MNQSGTNIFEEYEITPLIPIQGANKAGIMPDGSLAGTRPEHMPKLTLFERLFGKSANPTDQVGDNNVTISQTPRVGGIFPDISAGYNENRNTPISLNNFGQNKLEDGRNKGFAYKLGEGLGSLARFAESPAGRGLLMAGLVGATGGGALPALAFGGGAGLLNQQNRMKDTMYRNELGKMGFDTSGIRGYISDDTFNKIFQSKQLQDNAEYRNALLKGQRLKNEALIAQKQAELKHKQMSEAADRALKSRELDIKEMQALNEGKGTQDKGQLVFDQLQLLEDAFQNMPQSKAAFGSKGKALLTGATNLVGLRNDDVTAYEAIRNPLVTTLARTIAGEKGVLTDKDFARAEKMVPTSFDSAEQAQAKFREIRKLVGVSLGGSQQTTNNDPLGIRG